MPQHEEEFGIEQRPPASRSIVKQFGLGVLTGYPVNQDPASKHVQTLWLIFLLSFFHSSGALARVFLMADSSILDGNRLPHRGQSCGLSTPARVDLRGGPPRLEPAFGSSSSAHSLNSCGIARLIYACSISRRHGSNRQIGKIAPSTNLDGFPVNQDLRPVSDRRFTISKPAFIKTKRTPAAPATVRGHPVRFLVNARPLGRPTNIGTPQSPAGRLKPRGLHGTNRLKLGLYKT